ncbi:MAG: right-handed parallel beta-helix repeat-containing protein [Thermoplasmata archaeon]|nr:MAG: right-handed parallel beta-helix repeat-containing protein [Thermoplasmata archaeon]
MSTMVFIVPDKNLIQTSCGSATIYVPTDYSTIQDAINASNDGDTVYVYNGIYYEHLVVNKTINLIGEDRENTIIDGGGSGDVVRIIVDWVNISGFTITKNGPFQDQTGLKIISDNNTIFGNNIINNSNGIYLLSSSGNNISNNNFSSNGRDWGHSGIYFEGSNRNFITNNTAFNNGNGIYLTQSCNYNTITDNIAISNKGPGIRLDQYSNYNIITNNAVSNNSDGIMLFYSSYNIIVNNNISYNRYGINIETSCGNTLVNNMMLKDGIRIWGELVEHWNTHTIDTSNTVNGKPIYYWENRWGGTVPLGAGQVILANCEYVKLENYELRDVCIGIQLGFSNNNIIVNNTVSSNIMYGMTLRFSEYNTIVYNTVSKNRANGFHFYNSSYNTLTCNNVTNNNEEVYGVGIYITYDSNYNTITHNDISSNARNGISISLSIGNTIKDNTFTFHFYAIFLSSSNWNNIIGNNISNNVYGIRLDGISSQNNIIDNLVSNNGWGIYLQGSPNNRIYHNNIVDNNPTQAYDDRSDNFWDDGYPSGGNYWSDYGGVDDYKGPMQNILGSDGIGDTPYVIDLDSQDNYPLMDLIEGLGVPFLPPTLYINVSQDGEDVILNWDPPSNPDLAYYLLYRSPTQVDFDFDSVWVNTSSDFDITTEMSPIPLRTQWRDAKAALPGDDYYQEQFYYVIRAVNDDYEVTGTSRTVGKWTRIFPQGVSTFSLPLEPIEVLYTDNLTTNMNAEYIRYMNATTRTWMQHNFGDGDTNNTQMKLGEGYEVKFSSQTIYTFYGMPGAMISYHDNSGFLGFNPAFSAKNLQVDILPFGDVYLTWQEPAGMGSGDWYEVYYSNTRDGFFRDFGDDYFFARRVDYGTNTTTHNGIQANIPGARLYYMVVPFNVLGTQGASTYSIGIWTEEYFFGYDTMGIPLILDFNHTADWYCDNIPDTVGINYFDNNKQRWCWHSTIMPKGAFDIVLEMTKGYQISTSNNTKFIFIGI